MGLRRFTTQIESHTSKLLFLALLCLPPYALASPREEMGYNRLLAEYPGQIPDGSGVAVAMVEFSSGTWSPTPSTDRKFIYPYSSYAGTSAHANLVAQSYYGSNSSSPGIRTIYSLNSSDWMLQHLQIFSSSTPLATPWEVESHSWIGSVGGGEHWVLQASDYRVNRDNTLIVAGLNNNTDPVPPLAAQFFNGIVVGRTNGNHSRGGTNNPNEIPGRMKPDLIGPSGFTSYATPLVASAAVLLIDKAKSTPGLEAARDNRVLKAMLMAGASKDRWPAWSNSSETPLDPVWGAGMVNVYRSWHILTAGRHEASPKSLVATRGWDLAIQRPSQRNFYFFEIPEGNSTEFSVVLAWNRELTYRNGREYGYTLENLDLRLWKVDRNSFKTTDLLRESRSQKDNVEHIYLRDLPAGRYAMEVFGGNREVSYALAWYCGVAPARKSSSINIELLSPETDSTISLGQSIEVSGKVEGSAALVQWLVNGQPIAESGTEPWTLAWQPVSPGTYTVSMQARASNGETIISGERTIRVESSPIGPLLVLLPPVNFGYPVELQRSYSVTPVFPNGWEEVALAELRENGVTRGISIAPPFAFTWTPQTAGIRELSVHVLQLDANPSASPIQLVAAMTPANPGEIRLLSPASGTQITAWDKVSLVASVGNPSEVRKVEFLVNQQVVNVATIEPFAVQLLFIRQGTHAVQARVHHHNGMVLTSESNLVIVP